MDKEKAPWRKNSKYTENEQEMWDYILANSMNVTTLFNWVRMIEQKVNKLDEAYYIQFPDRVQKDAEFQKQFDAVKKSPEPGPSQKKP